MPDDQIDFGTMPGGTTDTEGLNPGLAPGMTVWDARSLEPFVVRPFEGRNGQFISFHRMGSMGQDIVNTGQFFTADGVLFQMQNARVVGSPRRLTKEERDALAGLSPGSSGSSGGSSLGDQLAYIREQARLQAEENRRQEAFQAAQAGIERKNQTRMMLYGQAQDLAGQLIGMKEQARQLLAQTIGQDPTRSAVLAAGGLQRGTTPTQAFRGQLQQTAAQKVPEIPLTPETRPKDLAYFINTLRNRLQLPETPPIGFAGGTEGTGKGMLVGEAGPEVVEFTPDGRVRVIPLVTSAQNGLDVDMESIQQALSPIYSHLGFNQVPMANRSLSNPAIRPGGYHPLSTTDILSRLGVRPRLVRLGNDAQSLYYADPSGRLSAINPYTAFGDIDAGGAGFRPQDVVQFQNPQNFNQLGRMLDPLGLSLTGQTLEGPPPLIEPYGGGGPMATALNIPGGAMLPDPRLFANIWRRLDSATKALVENAYSTAGYGLDLDDAVMSVTPTGGARTGQTALLA